MPDEKRDLFCSVPGCIDRAEGAILFAYVKEARRYLCVEHMAPHRDLLQYQLRGEVVEEYLADVTPADYGP